MIGLLARSHVMVDKGRDQDFSAITITLVFPVMVLFPKQKRVVPSLASDLEEIANTRIGVAGVHVWIVVGSGIVIGKSQTTTSLAASHARQRG
jgi:hypothetical protein